MHRFNLREHNTLSKMAGDMGLHLRERVVRLTIQGDGGEAQLYLDYDHWLDMTSEEVDETAHFFARRATYGKPYRITCVTIK